MGSFLQLYNLYEEELYSSAHTLAQLTLSSPKRNNLTQDELFSTIIINALSLYDMKYYKESADNYEKALMVRKQIQILKTNEITAEFFEKYQESEIKFNIAKCYVENHLHKDAATLLHTIPLKQRSAKVCLLLSKILLDYSSADKSLIAIYKEVLRKCPLSFEAIDGLLNLGVKGSEVNSLIINALLPGQSDWMNLYIRAISEMHNRKYSDAIQTINSIDTLNNNPKILAMIGDCFYYNGDYEKAHGSYKRAHDTYPYMKNGIQKYAMLCHQLNKIKELETIIIPSSSYPTSYSSETWFVMAQYLMSTLKYEKALYFIQRVILINQERNVDALILNSKILHMMKKPNDALASLRTALKYEVYRYEIHRGIIDILMDSENYREAQFQATKSLKQLGDTPRILTLAASTYMKAPISKNKAKMLLSRALDINECYVKAIFLLSQILIDDKEVKAAVKLLEKTSASVSNIKIFLLLADLYAKNKNHSQALQMYTKAFNVDSTNRHAFQGLMSLGYCTTALDKTLDISSTTEEISDNTLELPVQGKIIDSDDEDIVWSDGNDVEMDNTA
ncbi:unnamed protein product [Diamesa hyperborea]